MQESGKFQETISAHSQGKLKHFCSTHDPSCVHKGSCYHAAHRPVLCFPVLGLHPGAGEQRATESFLPESWPKDSCKVQSRAFTPCSLCTHCHCVPHPTQAHRAGRGLSWDAPTGHSDAGTAPIPTFLERGARREHCKQGPTSTHRFLQDKMAKAQLQNVLTSAAGRARRGPPPQREQP